MSQPQAQNQQAYIAPREETNTLPFYWYDWQGRNRFYFNGYSSPAMIR